MKAEVLLNTLTEFGYGIYSGVPCSYLTPLINATIDSPDIDYINAANEGEAVAICSGAEVWKFSLGVFMPRILQHEHEPLVKSS